ncbi:MAG: hypothetical protein LUQ71_10435 [Methanoregula sp.]|nr:hypothetical protein [Methanoregula sp.]
MDARAEAASLAENPLGRTFVCVTDEPIGDVPTEELTEVDPEYTQILGYIDMLDREIARLQERMSALEGKREKLLQDAIDHQVEEDQYCKLIREVKQPSQKINIEILKTNYAAAYKSLWEAKKAEKKAELALFGKTVKENKVDFDVNQTDAKKALKDIGVVLDVVLYRPGEPKVTYSLIRKGAKA